MQAILEAEGWVESVVAQKVSALQIGACWTSILKLQQPQLRCGALKGLKGFWWVMVNKKPESEEEAP